MKIFFLFFSLLVLSFCEYSLSQTTINNFIGGSFGGSDFHIEDAHASPLFFGGVGISPNLQYIHKGEVSRHYVEAAYYYDYLWTSQDNFTNDNYRGRIRYSYVHSVLDFNFLKEKISFLLGGSITSFFHHSDYYHNWIPPTTVITIESWYWSTSLDLSAQLDFYPSERESFTIQLFIPVVSNVSRPTYSTSGDFNYDDNDWKFKMFGETEFFPANFALNTLITYTRPLFWNLNLQFNYEFYYAFFDEPKEIQMYMNNLRVGLFYCF